MGGGGTLSIRQESLSLGVVSIESDTHWGGSKSQVPKNFSNEIF